MSLAVFVYVNIQNGYRDFIILDWYNDFFPLSAWLFVKWKTVEQWKSRIAKPDASTLYHL